MFYSVYIGKYPTANIPKKDRDRISALGMTPYIFRVADGYSIRIASFPSREKAENAVKILVQKGFEAYCV